MKKNTCIILCFILIICLCACGAIHENIGTMDNAVINLDGQSYYTKQELESALGVVESKFKTWPGFVMNSIEVSYAGDDASYCNELSEDIVYDEALTFTSSFTTGENDWDGFSKNVTYENWNWYLARANGGQWHLVSWGVC